MNHHHQPLHHHIPSHYRVATTLNNNHDLHVANHHSHDHHTHRATSAHNVSDGNNHQTLRSSIQLHGPHLQVMSLPDQNHQQERLYRHSPHQYPPLVSPLPAASREQSPTEMVYRVKLEYPEPKVEYPDEEEDTAVVPHHTEGRLVVAAEHRHLLSNVDNSYDEQQRSVDEEEEGRSSGLVNISTTINRILTAEMIEQQQQQDSTNLLKVPSSAANINGLAETESAVNNFTSPRSGGGLRGGSAANHTGSKLYPCSECHKVFRHPMSLHHHRHVHRGTYTCQSCSKVFSRRWDLHRHLHRSKLGCRRPASSSSGSMANSTGGVSTYQVLSNRQANFTDVDSTTSCIVTSKDSGFLYTSSHIKRELQPISLEEEDGEDSTATKTVVRSPAIQSSSFTVKKAIMSSSDNDGSGNATTSTTRAHKQQPPSSSLLTGPSN